MVAAINRHGGRAANIMLPEIGITGNTHFPMMDLNNVRIADLLSRFLADYSWGRALRGSATMSSDAVADLRLMGKRRLVLPL